MKYRITVLAFSLFSAVSVLTAQGQEKVLELMDSLSMVAPQIRHDFDEKYRIDNLDYGMTIGIEQTPGGRIWN